MTWSLPTEGIFQVNDQNRPVANLPVVVFRSQPREMTLPKAEYVTFGFYFRTLVLFLCKQSLNITVLKLRGFFSVLSSHNPKTLRQTRANSIIPFSELMRQQALRWDQMPSVVWIKRIYM